jgi:hypothetical protein
MIVIQPFADVTQYLRDFEKQLAEESLKAVETASSRAVAVGEFSLSMNEEFITGFLQVSDAAVKYILDSLTSSRAQ